MKEIVQIQDHRKSSYENARKEFEEGVKSDNLTQILKGWKSLDFLYEDAMNSFAADFVESKECDSMIDNYVKSKMLDAKAASEFVQDLAKTLDDVYDTSSFGGHNIVRFVHDSYHRIADIGTAKVCEELADKGFDNMNLLRRVYREAIISHSDLNEVLDVLQKEDHIQSKEEAYNKIMSYPFDCNDASGFAGRIADSSEEVPLQLAKQYGEHARNCEKCYVQLLILKEVLGPRARDKGPMFCQDLYD
jgi:hypothetical protein